MFCGVHGVPRNPLYSMIPLYFMDSIVCHEFHRIRWSPWNTMEDYAIHGIHGTQWNPWNAMATPSHNKGWEATGE